MVKLIIICWLSSVTPVARLFLWAQSTEDWQRCGRAVGCSAQTLPKLEPQLMLLQLLYAFAHALSTAVDDDVSWLEHKELDISSVSSIFSFTELTTIHENEAFYYSALPVRRCPV